jgi:hypothetical protein
MKVEVIEKQDHASSSGPAKIRFWLVLAGFLVIVGALLLTEHRAHVLGLLIWLPLLACPLMHIFMHRGHDGHASRSKPRHEIDDDE